MEIICQEYSSLTDIFRCFQYKHPRFRCPLPELSYYQKKKKRKKKERKRQRENHFIHLHSYVYYKRLAISRPLECLLWYKVQLSTIKINLKFSCC